MTADKFVECVLDEYEAFCGNGLIAAERAVLREFLLADVPNDSLSSEITAKLSALILHRSLHRLTDEKDDDWGPARRFKDIYDCRVCANAVAQVSVKGIFEPLAEDEFGMARVLTDREAKEAVLRLFDRTKRVTILLELKTIGN